MRDQSSRSQSCSRSAALTYAWVYAGPTRTFTVSATLSDKHSASPPRAARAMQPHSTWFSRFVHWTTTFNPVGGFGDVDTPPWAEKAMPLSMVRLCCGLAHTGVGGLGPLSVRMATEAKLKLK